MTNLPQIHVRLVDHRWAVLRADETYPVSTHPRREDAITVARALAVRENAEVVLFDEIGKPPPPPGQSPPPGGASGQACL